MDIIGQPNLNCAENFSILWRVRPRRPVVVKFRLSFNQPHLNPTQSTPQNRKLKTPSNFHVRPTKKNASSSDLFFAPFTLNCCVLPSSSFPPTTYPLIEFAPLLIKRINFHSILIIHFPSQRCVRWSRSMLEKNGSVTTFLIQNNFASNSSANLLCTWKLLHHWLTDWKKKNFIIHQPKTR